MKNNLILPIGIAGVLALVSSACSHPMKERTPAASTEEQEDYRSMYDSAFSLGKTLGRAVRISLGQTGLDCKSGCDAAILGMSNGFKESKTFLDGLPDAMKSGLKAGCIHNCL